MSDKSSSLPQPPVSRPKPWRAEMGVRVGTGTGVGIGVGLGVGGDVNVGRVGCELAFTGTMSDKSSSTPQLPVSRPTLVRLLFSPFAFALSCPFPLAGLARMNSWMDTGSGWSWC